MTTHKSECRQAEDNTIPQAWNTVQLEDLPWCASRLSSTLAMNIFGRRRKESAQLPSSSSSPSKGHHSNPISVLAASLPRSYRQQNSGSDSNSGGTFTPPRQQRQKRNDASLPATPTTAGKENAFPAASADRTQHRNATAPAGRHEAYNLSGDTYISELGQIQHGRISGDPAQPAFMVTGSGAGQQHHTVTGAGKQNLPPIPRDPSSKQDISLKALPNLKIANRRMSTGSIPSIDAMMSNNRMADTAELQVSFEIAASELQALDSLKPLISN